MLKWWQTAALIVAIWGCGAVLGIWGRHGFPVVAEKCEYTADGIKYGCAFYNVGYIALWKIGSELSNLTAVATLFTAIATLAVALVTQNQLKHNRVVQRAYVNMSPKTGLVFREDGRIGITLQIKNQGVTPAHVTDVLITADTFPNGQTLPETPPYQRSHEVVPKAYLAANDFFDFYATMKLSDAAQVVEARQGMRQLLIFGYVDYIDQFRQRHRGGFARRYDNRLTELNLTLVTETEYNYDRAL